MKGLKLFFILSLFSTIPCTAANTICVNADDEVEDNWVLTDPCDPCDVCHCWGDVADAFQQPPGDGEWVDFGDLNYLIIELSKNDWFIAIADRPDLACADVSDTLTPLGCFEGYIDFGDLNYMISELWRNGWAIPCSTGGIDEWRCN